MTSDPRTLHLAWSTPLQDERNGEIIQYGINLTDIQSGEVMHFFAYDSVTSVTIQHLHPHYYYNYTLTAFTSAGNGPYSPTDYVQMPQDGKCTTHSILNKHSGNYIALTWGTLFVLYLECVGSTIKNTASYYYIRHNDNNLSSTYTL